MNFDDPELPQLVIFRLPDDEEGMVLVELSFDDQGMGQTSNRAFVLKDKKDWYNETEFYHIILAYRHPDGGSWRAQRFAIGGENEATTVIHELDGAVILQHVVDILCAFPEEFKPQQTVH